MWVTAVSDFKAWRKKKTQVMSDQQAGEATDDRGDMANDLEIALPETTQLQVSYPNKVFKNGETLDRSTVTLPPSKVTSAVAEDGSTYCVFFLDPDAPSRAKPESRCWLHWAWGNCSGSDVLTGEYNKSGQELIPYITPAPPRGSGPHRYTYLLFKQEGESLLEAWDKQHDRTKFNVKTFMEENQLGDAAIGWQYFLAENKQ